MKIKHFWKKAIGVILLIIAVVYIGDEALKKIRQYNGVFRFEDYSDAQEAQAVLLAMHPVRSPAAPLKEMLAADGGHCNIYSNPQSKAINCSYKQIDFFVVWQVQVIILVNSDNNIQSIRYLRQWPLPITG